MKKKPVSHARGAALISVLALIVLMAALATVFLVRTATERSASASYDAASGTRLLAETTVNLAQATINQATTGASGTTWASQPGAIRVFNDSGALTTIYRLYSGTTIATDTSSGAVLAGDIPPPDWAGSPAVWVDLNKPVTISGLGAPGGPAVPDGLAYPILDPRDPKNPGTATSPNILTDLDGFGLVGAPGSTTVQPAPMPVRWLYVLRDGQIVTPTPGGSGSVTIPGATASNPITGRIAFWADDETAKVNINTAAGSLATWSGTTLPGTWDTPRFRIWTERMLFSENQPVKGEYQRYPGHPATTDVSRIFSALGFALPNYPHAVSAPTISPQPGPVSGESPPYSLLPRFTDNFSSQGGSRNTTRLPTPPVINGGVPKSERLYASAGEVVFDPDRNPSGVTRQQMETGKFLLTTHSRSPETTLFGTPRIAMWPLDAQATPNHRTTFDKLLAFCATTGTGAQALPYYIQRQNARDTAGTDFSGIPRNTQLMDYLKTLTSRPIPGFGGSFGGKYSHARSGNIERDQILAEIFDYIRTTNLFDHSLPQSNTSFNRFTAKPAGLTSYGFEGVVAPLRIGNVQGLGRILTLSEIGVLIICTADGNSPLGAYQAPGTVAGAQVSPVKGSAHDPLYVSNLPVAQFLRDTTGTDGRIVGLDATKTPVTGTETAPPSGANPFPANPTLTTTGEFGGPLQALAPGQKKLQAMLLFELACPMMGFDAMNMNLRPPLRINVSNIQGLAIGGQNPFPSRTSSGTAKAANTNGNGLLDDFPPRTDQEQGTGGILGFRYTLRGRFNTWSGQEWLSNLSASTRPYRYISNPFTVSSVDGGGNPLPLSLGGGFRTELQLPTTTGGDTYQTFNVTFPGVNTIPMPDLIKTGLAKTADSPSSEAQDIAADWWGFDLRIRQASGGKAINSRNQATLTSRYGAVFRADPPVANWNYKSTTLVEQPSFSNQNDPSKFGGSDVVRTLVARDGDYRLVAGQTTVDADGTATSPFAPGPGYSGGVKIGNLFRDHFAAFGTAGTDITGQLVNGAPYGPQMVPKVPGTLANAKQSWDWDNGLPWEPDGAHANKPDEGNIYVSSASPYYNREQSGSFETITSYFTPNRIVSSPGMLGSLPTGVLEGVSWRTLLFRPQADRPQDPAGPKDHLLMDLFNMPVVEPYAIGEPFSTDGKVNMNYQIVPFTYITRNTGVRAALGSELLTRVPKAAAANQSGSFEHTHYKPTSASGPSPGAVSVGGTTLARLPLNLNDTDGSLRQFREKFAGWDIFRSPSEICDIYLVPDGYSWDTDTAADTAWYGDEFALVGDNVRERPYGNIYPRLTTKSNTFTVHFTVQTLKNPPGDNPATWTESHGVVTGELRGSTTLERFLDPANTNIPDYATTPNAPALDTFYQWRVLSSSTFAP